MIDVWQVSIRNNATGECVTIPYEASSDSETDLFIWEEGNYSCDCNRNVFFCRALRTAGKEIACGDVAFSIPAIYSSDGNLIYGETPRGARRERCQDTRAAVGHD